MKRWILLISLLLVVTTLTLVGFGSWLLNSSSGADWLLKAVSNTADVQITIGQLDGQLADDLVIKELIVEWQGGQLTIEHMHLDWEPFSILQGKLNIQTLDIGQMVIRNTDSPDAQETTAVNEEDASFSIADLALLPGWLTVKIDRLQLQGFAIQNGEDSSVIADELSGNYLLSQRQIKAPEFSYISPYVHLRGAFDYDLQEPHLDMTADVHLPESLVSPQLFQDIAVPVSFPGQIAFAGDWNEFSGPVSFGTGKDVDDTVWLAAYAKGSWQGIRFDDLRGWYLNGSLAGDLDLAWIDSYRMHGELSGTGMDPGVLVEDLNGKTRLDVTGDLLVTYDDQPLQARLAALIHEGQLRGHAVAGSLAAQWQGGGLHDLDLDLNGEEASVVARGKPSERLELDIAVADLRPFHPDLAGQLLASGWLKWSDNYLTGEIDGTGEEIVWQESSLASLSFEGRHLKPQAPLQLELNGQGLQHAGIQLDHLQAGVDGSLQSHNARLMINGSAVNLEAQLSGHYQDEVWQGELASLSAQSSTLGAWALDEPAIITWQTQSLSLAGFSLLSSREERVTFEASRLLAATTSQVALTWDELSHDWLAYLKLPLEVSGRSSGELQLKMLDRQPVSLKAQLSASADIVDDLGEVAIPALTANLSWLPKGLILDVNAVSDSGEVIVAKGHSSEPPSWQWPPEQLSLDMRWQKLNLERLSRFRKELDIQGHSDGKIQIDILAGQLMLASASITADGVMQQNAKSVGFHSLLAELNWEEKGFDFDAQLKGVHDGTLNLELTSTSAPRLSWPKTGRIEFGINGLDIQSLNPLLPEGASFDGVIRGHSSGYWQEDGQIFLEGQVGLSESDLVWHSPEGQIDVTMRQADLEWQWQGDHLTGSLTLLLAEEGELRGRWQLPLPARWPVRLDEDGALQAELQGEMRATGLIVAFAPGMIQDLQGQIKSDLQINGTWQDPDFSGRMALTGASAYLPTSGVTLEDLNLQVALLSDKLEIEEFTLRSGPGTMRGTGWLGFDQWKLERYQLNVEGERLQVYNFPELQILCSPDLTLTGDPEGIHLLGSLLIPEMSVLGTATAPEFLPSNDVVIYGEGPKDRKVLPIDADLQVVVELGDQVWVRTAGIDTRLEGGGTVTLDEKHQLATFGEIRLVEGVYKAYGANLDIKQGLLRFTGGPLANPRLRIFAARDIDTVQAGVQITGTAEAPVVALYSRPAMPERDIIGYIFMGRPMRVGQEGEDALMIGAGALMPRYGETFSDLGISEIDIQGLFTGEGGVRLRKRLAESWELVSTLGIESGIDLYYIFEFD
jgi:translocation and assembly module TamB